MNLKNIRMNWGSIFLRGKIYEWIGKYTNELGINFFWRGRYTNELEDIRMNWGLIFWEREDNWQSYEWIGVHFFLRGNIYEWIGKHTNELGFRFFRAEYIRMNWKTYEWIGVAGRLAGRDCLSLCDNGWQAKSSLCDNLRTDYMTS